MLQSREKKQYKALIGTSAIRAFRSATIFTTAFSKPRVITALKIDATARMTRSFGNLYAEVPPNKKFFRQLYELASADPAHKTESPRKTLQMYCTDNKSRAF